MTTSELDAIEDRAPMARATDVLALVAEVRRSWAAIARLRLAIVHHAAHSYGCLSTQTPAPGQERRPCSCWYGAALEEGR